MTTITIFQNQNYKYEGFRCAGHAGYAEYGEDVVCAGLSALIINTINSIDSLTSSKFSINTDEDTGLIDFHFSEKPDSDAILLIKSLILGLQGIQKDYGDDFVSLQFKEV